jgi:hypothetical protein
MVILHLLTLYLLNSYEKKKKEKKSELHFWENIFPVILCTSLTFMLISCSYISVVAKIINSTIITLCNYEFY